MNKIGRNESCPCGSGKKYKQCCMKQGALASEVSKSVGMPSQTQISNALTAAGKQAEMGNLKEAAALCRNVLQYVPNNAIALNLLGILAYQAGNDSLAIELLKRAVTAQPHYADAHNNFGVVLRDNERSHEAIEYFKKALEINPHYLDALINYGNALQDIGKLQNAVTLYRRSLQIAPGHPGALSNLGNALQELGRHQDAVEVFQKLLTMFPDYEYALGSMVFSKRHCCDWTLWDEEVSKILFKIEEGKRVCKPFDLLAIADSPVHQLLCARVFSQHEFPEMTSMTTEPHCKNDKISVAYLSADFRQHAVSQLLVQLIEEHDRSCFNVIGISYGEDDQSPLRKRMVQAFDQFIDVRHMGDRQVAALLREMQVDIAIDLMGFTTDSRLGILAERAAPVQAGFLGYAGTTGTNYIDYLIADKFIVPEGARDFYTEQLVYLPNCFQPNDTNREVASNTPTREECGLPEHGIVFCAFNTHYKIAPPVFDLWMRLLSRVEGSVLWLACCNDTVKVNLRQQASNKGVRPERIVFAERTQELKDHLARHRLADIFLDTWPYNAHTTASDALWAGLPVLTYSGKSNASRVAGSLLQAVGLPELITESLEGYEELAIRLATNRSCLDSLKEKLKEQMATAPLFDTYQYRRHFEEALRIMVHRERNRQSPENLTVAQLG
jgi:protein O-GlcNAc transferase